jgi:hypothetical protein
MKKFIKQWWDLLLITFTLLKEGACCTSSRSTDSCQEEPVSAERAKIQQNLVKYMDFSSELGTVSESLYIEHQTLARLLVMALGLPGKIFLSTKW